ncbi:MAG: UDP-N-acetylmuramoyl-tripeptide-D-alanyl-D-alanine ligase [Candidatus Tokpelaia hoelldobleri]|uniref:UDP-N-acetylmuramoyl-tripeptide--D-alanyl-D-alanine ligase n=1 Tax=Candidatus Tokpelaia hoelldobleri TaxID=1902579 RepID=A0A1U9JVY6_9HYPH|nr:MAG: UDP-N-acetylmuramoyl-tripeptide-D-alanyl-D-alanine ligase [Candidatus Tokpelaia hoelldoblerii]
MKPLWTGQAFVDAIGGSVSGVIPESIKGISIDSRTLEKGEAFFAIRGANLDGHEFAAAAAKAGAAVLVVEKAQADVLQKTGVALLLVDDVLAALTRLGVAARERTKAEIIAVTGSVGKTTTKEMLRFCLGGQGRVHANPASFNNHWGVPLTLARMPEETDYGIFEIGMNHENEIRPLVKLVRPHVALITRIAAAHMGYFTSLEAIAHAKAEIFEGLAPQGVGLLNADDPLCSYLEKRARAAGCGTIATFGRAENADYRLLENYPHAGGSCFEVDLKGTQAVVKLGVAGSHMVDNALGVLAAADCVGADVAHIVLALPEFREMSGRGARYTLSMPDGGCLTLIDESYNANPASMRAGLALLGDSAPASRGRRIAVLGDMLELGQYSRAAHEDLAGPLRLAKTNLVFLAGKEMEYLERTLRDEVPVEYRKSVADLLPAVFAALRSGDVVMVKSSNGIGTARIVSALLERYPPLVS